MAEVTLDKKNDTNLQLPRIWLCYPNTFTLLAHVMGTFLTTLVALLVLHLGNLPTGQCLEHPANTVLHD